MINKNPNMDTTEYFNKPQTTAQKQYCALAAFFKDGLPAKTVAKRYNYTIYAFYSLVRNFTKQLRTNREEDPFFKSKIMDRKKFSNKIDIERFIVSLRKKNLSNIQIAYAMNYLGIKISQSKIWRILNKNGYKRVRRRKKSDILKGEMILESIK